MIRFFLSYLFKIFAIIYIKLWNSHYVFFHWYNPWQTVSFFINSYIFWIDNKSIIYIYIFLFNFSLHVIQSRTTQARFQFQFWNNYCKGIFFTFAFSMQVNFYSNVYSTKVEKTRTIIESWYRNKYRKFFVNW